MDSSNVGALPIDRSILANIRSRYGAPRSTSNASDSDLVEYLGVRMEIGEAINQGLLERDGNGRLSIPDANARDAAEAAKQQQADAEASAELRAAQDRGDEADSQTLEAVRMVNETVPAKATQVMLDDYLNNQGTVSLENLHQIARSVGMSTQSAETMFEALHRGYSKQALAIARNAGLSEAEANDAWAWSMGVDQTEHLTAVRSMVMAGDTKGLRRIIGAWKGRNNGRTT